MNMVCHVKRRFPLLGERLEACRNPRCTIQDRVSYWSSDSWMWIPGVTFLSIKAIMEKKMRRTLNHWNRLTLAKRKGPNRHDGTQTEQMACFWKSKLGLNMDHSTAPSGKKQTDIHRLRHVLRVAAQWCVKECSFAAMFQHWHWSLRRKSLCVLLMKSHLVWRKFLRLWHITDVTILKICEGYWIFWLRLFVVFQYSVIVSSCSRFTAPSKMSSPQNEILYFFFFNSNISSFIQGHLIASYVFLLVFSFLLFLLQCRAVECSPYPICDQSS